MTNIEFKAKYFTYSFYWVDEYNFRHLQALALKLGLTWHTGCRKISNWKQGINNLVMFPQGHFQRVTCYFPDAEYGKPVDFEQMLSDYRHITD